MPIILSLPMDAAKVQHVTKKSSDELLSKFAQVASEETGKRRRKKRREDELCDCDTPSTAPAAIVERRSLLPSKVTRRRSAVLRQLRVRNKSSLFGSIHKTWRRTIEGASRVFLEKHYHPHKRLMNDIV